MNTCCEELPSLRPGVCNNGERKSCAQAAKNGEPHLDLGLVLRKQLATFYKGLTRGRTPSTTLKTGSKRRTWQYPGSGLVAMPPYEVDARTRYVQGILRKAADPWTTEYQRQFTWKLPLLPRTHDDAVQVPDPEIVPINLNTTKPVQKTVAFQENVRDESLKKTGGDGGERLTDGLGTKNGHAIESGVSQNGTTTGYVDGKMSEEGPGEQPPSSTPARYNTSVHPRSSIPDEQALLALRRYLAKLKMSRNTWTTEYRREFIDWTPIIKKFGDP
ncbi:hypothetical protein SpCBS45565_g04589 [Spizellomyces sp. 'palustris']|nr:hypothetical protein SpCBS45565_g04589 [Spizellomyces sp. 'palustris']